MVAFTNHEKKIVDGTFRPKIVLYKPVVPSKKQNQHGDKNNSDKIQLHNISVGSTKCSSEYST